MALVKYWYLLAILDARIAAVASAVGTAAAAAKVGAAAVVAVTDAAADLNSSAAAVVAASLVVAPEWQKAVQSSQ